MNDFDAHAYASLQLGGFVVTRSGKILTPRQAWIRFFWLPMGLVLAAIALAIAAAWLGWIPAGSGPIFGGGML